MTAIALIQKSCSDKAKDRGSSDKSGSVIYDNLVEAPQAALYVRCDMILIGLPRFFSRDLVLKDGYCSLDVILTQNI